MGPMKMLFFQKTDGSFAVSALTVEPKNFQSAGDSVVAQGKFPAYVGAFSVGELPVPNIDMLRFSAGAVVFKPEVARDIRWKVMRREAQRKLDDTNTAALQAIEEGSANPALSTYRRDLRAILAAKPLELTAAVNFSAIEAARPEVLDRPILR